MSYFWGIDPGGVSCSVALIDEDYTVLFCENMPIREMKKTNGKVSRVLDIAESIKSLNVLAASEWAQSVVVVEAVGPRPQEGSVSGFKFGVGYGFAQTVLLALAAGCGVAQVPFISVRPQLWRAAMIPSDILNAFHDTKAASVVCAKKLFGDQTPFKRVKDHNKADALLLAAFGRVSYGQ